MYNGRRELSIHLNLALFRLARWELARFGSRIRVFEITAFASACGQSCFPRSGLRRSLTTTTDMNSSDHRMNHDGGDRSAGHSAGPYPPHLNPGNVPIPASPLVPLPTQHYFPDNSRSEFNLLVAGCRGGELSCSRPPAVGLRGSLPPSMSCFF